MLSTALCASAVFGGAAATGSAQAPEKSYLVVFKNENSLPSGYQELIEKAGGKVSDKLEKVGAVEVSSANPDFLTAIKKSSSVQDAGVQKSFTRNHRMLKQPLHLKQIHNQQIYMNPCNGTLNK